MKTHGVFTYFKNKTQPPKRGIFSYFLIELLFFCFVSSIRLRLLTLVPCVKRFCH